MTLAELAAADMPPTITVDEAAELVGISRSAAYRAVHNGEIPSLRIGRRLLVPSASLLEMLGLDATDADGATRSKAAPTSSIQSSSTMHSRGHAPIFHV